MKLLTEEHGLVDDLGLIDIGPDTTWVGIDPGSNGSIAALDPEGRVTFHDLEKGAWVKAEESLPFSYYKSVPVMELTYQGGSAAGRNQGRVEALAVSTWGFVYLVTPAEWKRSLGLKGGKGNKYLSLEMARDKWPEYAQDFSRKKDLDRAEALLIAYYAQGKLLGKE